MFWVCSRACGCHWVPLTPSPCSFLILKLIKKAHFARRVSLSGSHAVVLSAPRSFSLPSHGPRIHLIPTLIWRIWTIISITIWTMCRSLSRPLSLQSSYSHLNLVIFTSPLPTSLPPSLPRHLYPAISASWYLPRSLLRHLLDIFASLSPSLFLYKFLYLHKCVSILTISFKRNLNTLKRTKNAICWSGEISKTAWQYTTQNSAHRNTYRDELICAYSKF